MTDVATTFTNDTVVGSAGGMGTLHSATHRALARTALTGLRSGLILRVSTVLFIAVGGGWEETHAVLVDVTRLTTAESVDRISRCFSD